MSIHLSPSHILAWADQQHPHKPLPYRAVHTFCRTTLITVREFAKNELSLRAAALTFTVILSLVPILAMSTAVVKGLGGSDQLKDVIYSYVATLENDNDIPPGETTTDDVPKNKKLLSSYTQHLNSAIEKIFAYVDKTNFTTLGTIGVAGIFFSVILVLSNIEMAMNTIWHVKSGRSVTRKISDYLALVVLMPISVNIGLAASAVLKSDALLNKFSVILPMLWIQALVLKFIPVFFLALTLYVIYLFFPNTKVKTIPAMVGAIFAGFFWFEVQNLYIALQVGVSKYNAIYGSFATLPLFLIWIYFGWIFILLGAQIAYVVQNKKSLRLVSHTAPASLKLAVAYDILNYVRNKFDSRTPATRADFSTLYPMYNISLVEEIIIKLKENNLIHTAAEKTVIIPSIPKEKLDHEMIVAAILGSTYSETAGGRMSRMILNANTTANNDLKDQEKNQVLEKTAAQET